MNFKQFVALLSVSTVVVMNVVATKALAQPAKPSIEFGKAIAAPGCVIADQLVKEDGRTLSILFDNFMAEEGNRKACSIRVDTTIPSGLLVQKLQVLYQGSTQIPSGSGGTSLSRSYIFSGGALGLSKVRPKISKFTSTNELFQEQDDLTAVSASCGGKGQFGINIVAQSSPGTSIALSLADLSSQGVEVHFDLAPC